MIKKDKKSDAKTLKWLVLDLKWLTKKSGMVIELYLSVIPLNFLAINIQAMLTPNTSPNTTQKALMPTTAPSPVNPNNNQADSPVALVEKAVTQKPSFLPPTKKSLILLTFLDDFQPIKNKRPK